MPTEVSPERVQEAVHAGHQRLKNFRAARLMFLRNYCGQYYDQDKGEVGTEALNLIFNAIRVLLPNIVMNFPKHNVEAKFVAHRDYAELQSLALSHHDKEIRIKDVYRRVIVDAIFTLGTLKTGIAESDSVYAFDEYDHIDVGEVYTEAVDFDNLIVDPNSRDHLFRDAAFIGDKSCVARELLLESGLYDNELIEKLPSVEEQYNKDDKAKDLSRQPIKDKSKTYLREQVEIAELWVPEAQATITVPADKNLKFEDYLRVDDYYGPDTGPYTFLALTPPVPGNPLPVPMVGVWNDLHTLANRMAKKIIDQAERQKDVVFYQRAAADDAEEAKQAGDGDAIAVDDINSMKVESFGGQQPSNEGQLASLHAWFNMMAGNPSQMGGERFDAESATEAQILAQNANIGLEDMKDLVYDMAATEASKRAWYFHTDPFIEVPLVRRVQQEAQYQMTPQGPIMAQPATLQDQQVYLTPEMRQGDWLDFNFSVQPESMGRKDQATQFAEAMDFAVKIMPSVLQSAQTAAMLGLPFSPQQFLIRMAKDRGIDWLDEVFYDPQFQMQMQLQMLMAPQDAGQGQPGQGQSGKAKQPANGAGSEGGTPQPRNMMEQILQNGQPGSVGSNPSQQTQQRSQQQQGAARSQRELKR